MTEHEPKTEIQEFRFLDCRVDLSTRELWRDDEIVSMEPKAFDLLSYLIRHRDRAVKKDELQDKIWAGVIVTEAALTRCVMKARRAIGDTAAKATAIKTVRGHGYRFNVAVEEIGHRPMTGRRLPLPDKPSLVVLPFVNLGNDPEQEYFSDGITEDIITELSRSRSLFVIARHSAFSFKNRDMKARDIASELGVAYVVDGSLQRSSGRIRINVRLVDAADDGQIWAERYDREIEDVLIVQEEVAAKVAATVGGRVEATRGRRRIDTAQFESYDCLLRAQALYYDFSKEANIEARGLLEKAIEVDPENARALAILAAVHSMDSWSFWSDDNERSKRLSLELGEKSIQIDDSDSLAHALFGEILTDCGELERSEFHFSRALALNPNDIAARALHASNLRSMGRVEEGIGHIEIAERLDPFGLLWIPQIKGSLMLAAKRYEEAVAAFYTISRPPNEARCMLIAALGRLGRLDEARHVHKQFIAAAKVEMPNYPGEQLGNWMPIFGRMLSTTDPTVLLELRESLELCGWR